MLTLEKIGRRLLNIDRLWSGDPDAAACKQSALREEVLKFIASGQCPDPVAFAKAVLGTDA